MTNNINFNDPTHLYLQIVNAIKDKIEKGVLKPGDQLGSQLDLAKQYSVSKITIKKACETLVNEGILYTRVGLGTFVADKQIKRNNLLKQKTIGLVLRDLHHPYFSMVVKSIEKRAYELGFSILLSDTSGNIEKEENQINHFKELGVNGLIIASLSLEFRATKYIEDLHRINFPYVMVSYIHDPDYWYVGSDHEYGGFIATEHLIKLGRKSIGYVHAERGNLLSEVRKNGYYRALLENDIVYDHDLVFYASMDSYSFGSDRYELGLQFGKNFSKLNKKPEAFVFYNDIVALGFMQAALDEGIKIPDDIAVIGYDDSMMSRYAAVPLTTVHQPVDNIGKIVVEVIQKRIDNIGVGNRTILKPSLIIRESCGAKIYNMQLLDNE